MSRKEVEINEMRRSLYQIYSSNEELEKAMKEFAVEQHHQDPVTLVESKMQAKSVVLPENDIRDNVKSSASTGAGQDIWGRYPGKEPKELIICQSCQRGVNSQRFAQHLDKCLNINTTLRSTSSTSDAVSTGPGSQVSPLQTGLASTVRSPPSQG